METLKLAFFTHDLGGGGAQRMLIQLANVIAARGAAVDFIVGNGRGTARELVSERLRLVDLRAHRTIRTIPSLVRYLRSARPDVLLTTPLHVNVAAALAWRIAGRPCPLMVREAVHLSTERRRSRLPAYALAPHVYRWATYVASVSEGVARDLIEVHGIPREKVRVLPNPTITSRTLELARRPIDHPWFDRKVPVLVSAGRLTEQKGFKTLLRAVAKVLEHQEVRLVILGEGSQRQELEQVIEDLGLRQHVDMPGYQPNPYAYIARADLFVLSSEWEGSPNVLKEALACGTPVVSTDCPSGPKEILDGGRFGELVPVGDPGSMAGAILRQLACSHDHDALRARGMEYSDERAADAYLRLMNEAVAAAG